MEFLPFSRRTLISFDFNSSQWPTDQADQDFDGSVKIDALMVFYLCHILLFNTDFVHLKNPHRVSYIQDKYLKMLHRYLKLKYDQEASKRLGNGIMILAFAREANEIRQKRLPV